MNIILPKERPVLVGTPLEDIPLFFLAGPVLGGGDWQKRMTELLSIDECVIVNPCRYGKDHPHYQHQVEGFVLDESQTAWERYYLRQAASGHFEGCIVFWLAAQVEERHDGKPYAADTRGELGEWRGHMMHERELRIVIGADRGFPGLSVIEKNFKYAMGGSFTIYSTMEDTARAAIAMARRPFCGIRATA